MPRALCLALLSLVLSAPLASAQGKDRFVQAVIGYLTTVENENADTESIDRAVGAMRDGLAAWDASISAMEAGLARSIASVPPAQAAMMRARLGAAYFERRRLADAVEQFNQARTLDPSFAPAHLFAGLALQMAGQQAAAAAAFSRTLALAPRDVATAYLASRYADAEAARTAGRATMEAAIANTGAVAPSVPFMSMALLAGARQPAFLPAAYAGVAELLASGRFDAFVALAADRRLAPGVATEQTALARARAFALAGRFDDAVALLVPLSTALPSAQAAWELSRVYVAMQREADARAALESAARARAVASEDRFFVALGRLRENQFAFDEAIDAFERAVAINPNDATAHRELGEAYAAQERLDAALSEFLIAAILDPLDAAAHVGRAQIYAARARLPEAISAFRAALSAAPDHLEARYGLARALTQAGQQEEGRRELEAYQRLQTAAMERERRRHDVRSEP